MNPRTKVIYRSCNVKYVESCNYSEIKDSEDGDYTFLGDEFAYEQDVLPVILDHNYAMRVVSKNKGDKLSDYIPINYNEAICSQFSEQWINAMKEELESLYENDTRSLIKRDEVKQRPINTK